MITCPICSHTSHHPMDEKQGYCNNCHAFTARCTICGGSCSVVAGNIGFCAQHAKLVGIKPKGASV